MIRSRRTDYSRITFTMVMGQWLWTQLMRETCTQKNVTRTWGYLCQPFLQCELQGFWILIVQTCIWARLAWLSRAWNREALTLAHKVLWVSLQQQDAATVSSHVKSLPWTHRNVSPCFILSYLSFLTLPLWSQSWSPVIWHRFTKCKKEILTIENAAQKSVSSG